MPESELPEGVVEFARGTVDLLVGCGDLLRNMRAHVITWEGGAAPKPVELHKLRQELETAARDVNAGKEALEELLAGQNVFRHRAHGTGPTR